MMLDFTSLVIGVTAGLITGGLAGVLHGLEKVADLQDRLRSVTAEVDKMREYVANMDPAKTSREEAAELEKIHHDLDEIHEEIRRLYTHGS
jgi:cell division protein FtsB